MSLASSSSARIIDFLVAIDIAEVKCAVVGAIADFCVC